MKKLLIILFVIISQKIFSEPLYVEYFNFAPTSNLYNKASWTGTDDNLRAKFSVTAGSLNYPGYIGTTIGNKARTVCKYPGAIYSNYFEECISGTVYASFLIRIDSLPANTTAGYTVFFDESGGSTNHTAKLYVKRLTSSTFNLGILKRSGIVKYAPAVYNVNTVYLSIISYSFKPGNADDVVKLYVGSAGIPPTEPATPLAFDTLGTDDNDIGEIGMNTSFLDTNLNGMAYTVDDIRIGTSWNSIFNENINYAFGFEGFIEGFYEPSLLKMRKDTIYVLMRDTVSPYSICDSAKGILDSTGNGVFNFQKASRFYTYYVVFKHRNSIETWSMSGNTLYDNTDYEFSFSSNTAFGNNLVKVGTKYCFYGGDIDQSGNVNLADMSTVYNAASLFTTGYKITDVTGDNVVNLTDMSLVFNNSVNFVSKVRP